MILSCPNCNARFLVADGLIPTEGRTVRCGACSHQWFVAHPNPEDLVHFKSLLQVEEIAKPPSPSPVTPSPESISPAAERFVKPTPNLPALTREILPIKTMKRIAAGLLLLWLIVAFFAYFPKGTQMPVISALYALAGGTPTDGLAFAELKMERENVEEGKVRFVLTGNILNRNKALRTVPTVVVVLKDADGKAIWTRQYPVNEKVAPGERYPFRIMNVETRRADEVKTIMLDLGNSLELMNR